MISGQLFQLGDVLVVFAVGLVVGTAFRLFSGGR